MSKLKIKLQPESCISEEAVLLSSVNFKNFITVITWIFLQLQMGSSKVQKIKTYLLKEYIQFNANKLGPGVSTNNAQREKVRHGTVRRT